MLAVKEDEDEDEDEDYPFRMPHPSKTRVVSQLVETGAALDLQDKVNYSNIIHYLIYLACLAETDCRAP